MVIIANSCIYVVENPAGTLIWAHLTFQQFCNTMAWVACWQLKSRTSDSLPCDVFWLLFGFWKLEMANLSNLGFFPIFLDGPFWITYSEENHSDEQLQVYNDVAHGLLEFEEQAQINDNTNFSWIFFVLENYTTDYGLFGQNITQWYPTLFPKCCNLRTISRSQWPQEICGHKTIKAEPAIWFK